MNASISLIKWKEKFIINEVRKIERMKIYAMWRMPQLDNFFKEEKNCVLNRKLGKN